MHGKSMIFGGAISIALFTLGCGGGDDATPSGSETEGDGSTGGMEDTASPGTNPGTNPGSADDDGDSGMPDDGDSGEPEPGSTGDETTGSMDETTGDESTGEMADVDPPVVLSVSPADGEIGVMPDVPLVIAFSEPMDKAATQAAYQSSDIPSGSVTMTWNDAGDELTVTPNEPLAWGQGTDEAQTDAIAYAYTLTTAARDLAGNELAADHAVEFSTIRQILQTLPPLGPWSGRIRADGFVAFDYIMVGDSGAQENAQYKGFVSFEISGLPDGITELQGAEMHLHHYSSVGDPYLDLGQLMAHDLEFTSMDVATFGAPSLGEVGMLSDAEDDGWRILDVTSFVADDYEADRDATQFRLEFETATDFNEDQDVAYLQTTSTDPAVMYLLYLIP
jgi:hypothetical protein